MTLATWLGASDALDELDAAHDAAWRVTDPDLLALCRDRLAMLLRHRPALSAMPDDRRNALRAWPTSDRFDERERAALEFTEQYAVDVAALSDDQVAAVRTHLGDDGLATFVNALHVLEQRMTLELGLTAVFGDEGDDEGAP